jgi:GNAT superfamily N-acetyltransferase
MTAQLDAGRVSIRPAVPSDLATIVEFRLAMFDDMSGAEAGPTPRPESLRRDNERWVAEHLGRDFFAWIAELDGRPVASAGLIWFAHPPGPLNPIGKEAYILNVYTRPEARRLGLARALMERLVEEASLAGVRSTNRWASGPATTWSSGPISLAADPPAGRQPATCSAVPHHRYRQPD